jgi:hypothetical protein
LFWFTVSEVSVHNWLAALLLACVRQNIKVVGACGTRTSDMAARKEQGEKRKGMGTRYTLEIHTPSDLLHPTRPHLPIVHSAVNSSVG